MRPFGLQRLARVSFYARRKLVLQLRATTLKPRSVFTSKNVQNWCDEISFSGLNKAKLTSQVFIELDLFVIPQRQRLENEKVQTLRFSKLFEEENKHVILLGQPGAGKTTSMKRL